MGNLINTVLFPLEWVVAWIMVGFHTVLTAIGLPEASGWTWGLSIVGLVVVIRIILIPLFVKQIQSSRKMQLIQPEMQKIQKKYKGKSDMESRQAMQAETMDLYKRTGTNPFSSCLPILLQSPIFFALFRVLNGLSAISAGKQRPIGGMTRHLAAQAEQSTLIGARLSDTFTHATSTNTRVLTVILIALMSLSTFTTQKQLMQKNMPASALDNPFAKQQKVLLYIMPAFFAVSGINFPIGVLLYWLTTNVWSMGQQFYTIRRMPAPGSPAERALEERRMKRGKAHEKPTFDGLIRSKSGGAAPADSNGPQDSDPRAAADLNGAAATAGAKSGQRQQPRRKARAKPVARSGATVMRPVATGEQVGADGDS
jgi:YidC/Oxa1 family membrane protein insertase